MPSRPPKQFHHDTTDQDLSNSFSGAHLDKSLRVEAEKIQNLESEINQALEKLDGFESREPKKTESITKKSDSNSNQTEENNEKFLENDSTQPNTSTVTIKKDSLRNFTS
jgi:hypothetical protein